VLLVLYISSSIHFDPPHHEHDPKTHQHKHR
jgi:hypothetical protein